MSFVPLFVAGVTPVTSALDQVKTGSGVVVLVISYEFETALHQLAVAALETMEVGFTFTVTSFTVPSQPFIVGVIK